VKRDEMCVAIYGASFVARAAANLVLKAVSLIVPMKLTATFVSNEAEGRAWLVEKRRARLTRNAPLMRGADPSASALLCGRTDTSSRR
jgi:hypothetical protein